MHNAAQTHTKQTTKKKPSNDTARLFLALPDSKATLKRVLRRIVFAVLFFAIIDSAIMLTVHSLSDRQFDKQYRFENGTDISPIRLYVDHIRTANSKHESDRTQIAFLGSSPAFGYRIKKSSNTYPYAFESEINRISSKSKPKSQAPAQPESQPSAIQLKKQTYRPFKVYNLASNGQLVADQYFIAKALIEDTDVFVVQLNYHTFNSTDGKRPAIRYPDLPKRLGINLSRDEITLIGAKPSLQETVNKEISQALSTFSFTFAQCDYITGEVFGGPPETKLTQWLQKNSANNVTSKMNVGSDNNAEKSEALFGESDTPFSELTPVRQILIIKRVSGLYDFKIDPNDREIAFLKKLVSILEEHNKKAIFFITALNVEALDEFGLFNWDAYDANSQMIRELIESRDFKFVDANVGMGAVPSDQFFDISHTLDAGGATFGSWLARETEGYLRKDPSASSKGASE